ncbi:uncharacterized protein LOC144756277 isoform X2 [Lissotriton helveticus]
MIFQLFTVLSLAFYSSPAPQHPQCTDSNTHLLPVKLSEIQGKWHLISSAYQKEEPLNLDKQATFGWMEITSTDGMKYGRGQQGQIVIYNHENLTFLEEDGSVKIKGRSHSGNDAEMEAFKTYSNCKNLDFMVERQSNFNYATECDSVTYMKDPLDPNTITGRWQLLARASVYPTVNVVERNPWVEFSWAEEKLQIHDGHGNFNFNQEEVELKGRNIVIGKANSTYLAFYQDCEECLLMRTENHQKVVVLHLLTRSGNYTDSQMKKFQTNSRCLSLPVLYKHEVSEPHEEEGTECNSMRHILDVFVPDKISGKWLMVAKAHSQPGKMEEEDDPWIEYSYDGHNLTIHEGRGKHSWPVKEIEVRGPKIVIQKENRVYVTFYPTCEDCLLMETDNGMEVVLNMFTRSGKLADSEIMTFKDKAHCLNLSNVLVYKGAKLHEEKAP